MGAATREEEVGSPGVRRPYRELHPAIFMMKPSENRPSGQLPEPLDRSIGRRILTQ